MGNFFGSIYSIFQNFIGIDLTNYLLGVTAASEKNEFIFYGLWMLVISLVIAIIFYYVINHPKLCNWWGWCIPLVVNAGINFWMGWQMLLQDFYDNKMVYIDPTTNLETPLEICESDILCFGVANMSLSIVAFIIFTFCIKWWSTNCSHAPV
ncbi:MAG: hypothetical protein ACI4AM_07215 [Muribaculaceae bacterium]